MQTGIGVGVGLHLLPGAAGGGDVIDELFTSDNASAWVASSGVTDILGGGRDFVLVGGGADPILAAAGSATYFRFPGTADNTLTVAGLSNSTVYDYTVTYEDETTATGTATSDGSGNLVMGGTDTEFDGVDVTQIEVYPDGGGSNVADLIASDADPDALTFAEAEAGLTVTIGRSTTGEKLAIIPAARYLLAGDDYFEAAYDALWEFADDEDYFAMIVLRGHNSIGAGMSCMEAGTNVSRWQMNWYLTNPTGTQAYVRISNSTSAGGIRNPTASTLIGNGIRRVASDGNQNVLWEDGTVSAGTLSADHGALTHGGSLKIGNRSGAYGNFEFLGAIVTKGVAVTDQQVADIVDALIARNGG